MESCVRVIKSYDIICNAIKQNESDVGDDMLLVLYVLFHLNNM